MAYNDYLHCNVCDKKCVYDANTDYDSESGADIEDIAVLCSDCIKTHKIAVIRNSDETEITRVGTCF